MTLEDALQELGIDASATPEEARRAYLHGVKIHKPETDPEGFRRLREAYEMVTGALAQPRAEPGPEEDEEEEESEVPPELAALAIAARAYLEGSRYDEAVAALGRALDRLAEMERPASRPFPVWLPRGILALDAASRATEARALHDRLWGWLSGTGDASLIQIWGHNFYWRLAHELGTLDPRFPPGLRRDAAQAALDGDLQKAVSKMEAFAQAAPWQAEEAAAYLYDLPILYSCFFRPLQQIPELVRRPAATEAGFSLRFLGWLVFVAVMILIRSFSGSDYPGSVAEDSGPTVYAVQAAKQEADEAWRAFRLSCEETPTPLPGEICDSSREVFEGLRDGNCYRARAAFSRLEPAVRDAPSSNLEPAVVFEVRLKHAMDLGCPRSP